jgi:hypothetical protein
MNCREGLVCLIALTVGSPSIGFRPTGRLRYNNVGSKVRRQMSGTGWRRFKVIGAFSTAVRGRRAFAPALVFGALLAASATMTPRLAHAEGLFDFLFGGPDRWTPPSQNYQHPPPPEARPSRVAPAALGHEDVTEGGGTTGHAVSFCVRLCDGHHFPMENMVKGTPVETCRAICPYSKTKVFFGSEIGTAVAQDGQHYVNLDTAFVYRKQLVANCTCNGRDAFGLAPLDVRTDPTLRPGDIVATKDGLASFTGRSGPGATFTPVNPATLPNDIR